MILLGTGVETFTRSYVDQGTDSDSTLCPRFHIRDARDWTNALLHVLMKEHLVGLKSRAFPTIQVEKPLGAPSQQYLQYDVVVMIGGGIGVTPFVSILRDMAIRLLHCHVVHYNARLHIQKYYFHWCNRDPRAFS